MPEDEEDDESMNPIEIPIKVNFELFNDNITVGTENTLTESTDTSNVDTVRYAP